jgi:1-deoxy-D-xylulose-5-phosphate synthase
MKKINVKKLSGVQCKLLCRNLRREIIKETLKNGGHLASSLGTVELTVALHRVFDFPGDKLVWDVGHQAYAHKLLTGRSLERLRKNGGVSGFPRISEGDDFIGGHSGIAISAALGFAEAIKLDKTNASAIAVVGDGAMTSGECFEGLNNAGKSETPLIIVLNQNDMSISKSVGALSEYLSTLRTDSVYKQVKKSIYEISNKIPFAAPVSRTFTKARKALKRFIYEPAITLFEQFGFSYIGPIDGHNSDDLEEAFAAAKRLRSPVVVHVNTIKGKGFEPAQKNPGAFHSFPEGHSADSPPEVSSDCFSCVFGSELVRLARDDRRICAITPAMKYASGLNVFSECFPERFFDVGIAEEHAVSFSAGLAAAGKLPVAAIYSSFLQRAYDQILHDLAASGLHAVLCVDRAGFVGEDGETHQGIYDVSMLCGIPNVTIYSPGDYAELRLCLKKALYETAGVAAVRYPRGSETEKGAENSANSEITEYSDFTADFSGKKLLCAGYGRQFNEIKKAQAKLSAETEFSFDTLKLTKIHPFFIPKEVLKYREIIFFEEGVKTGGAGEQFAAKLLTLGFRGKFRLIAADGYIKQNTIAAQLSEFGLDSQGVFDAARSVLVKERKG